jgi:ATP adenylyltransferase/5',5'''-P-1,P-4-tetraphosphate phosphorylase II
MFLSSGFPDGRDFSVRQVLHDFTESQKKVWPLAAANFDGLAQVDVRHFMFDGFQIKVQHNPQRIKSSVSNVDQASVAARPCFLCAANRPLEQESIDFDDRYEILVNPYPIFHDHFTITSRIHEPQRFGPNVESMLRLARRMEGFMVFYNGPECGASAPDHMHFQAGEKELLPLDAEFERLSLLDGRTLFEGDNTSVWAFDKYLRKMISVKSVSFEELLTVISVFYDLFSSFQPEKVEPMMNVLCSYSNGHWLVHFFPRRAHRPRQFYESGDRQILISPGSVDFGGLFILPRREDFEKITAEDIVDILEEVCLRQETFAILTENFSQELSLRL